MKYIEVTFTMGDTGVLRDILAFTLGHEAPYESFVETTDGLKAYVQAWGYDPEYLAQMAQAFPVSLKYVSREMEDCDINTEWEKGHETVLAKIGDKYIWLHPPFHPHRTEEDYEQLIASCMK